MIAAKNHLHDTRHGIVMGVKDISCDDAKVKFYENKTFEQVLKFSQYFQTNLNVDWYMNPENYTCYDDRRLYLPNSAVHPIHSIEHIPEEYVVSVSKNCVQSCRIIWRFFFFQAIHKCVNESIEYNEAVPTL